MTNTLNDLAASFAAAAAAEEGKRAESAATLARAHAAAVRADQLAAEARQAEQDRRLASHRRLAGFKADCQGRIDEARATAVAAVRTGEAALEAFLRYRHLTAELTGQWEATVNAYENATGERDASALRFPPLDRDRSGNDPEPWPVFLLNALLEAEPAIRHAAYSSTQAALDAATEVTD